MPRYPFEPSLRERVRKNLEGFDRKAPASESLTPAAVAVVLVGSASGEAAFVLTRRPPKLRRHGGQWALPGGRVDPPETSTEAALREIEEEVGLSLSPSTVLGALDDFPTRSGFVITPVVVWGPAEPALEPDPKEVAAAYVVGLHELDAPGIPRIDETADRSRPLLSISLASLGTTIFAPTAALIYQMREVALWGRTTRVAHFEQPRFAWR